MNKMQILTWYNERTQREKIAIIIASFAIIYFLWNFLLLRPIESSIRDRIANQKKIQQQIELIRTQRIAIQQVLSTPAFQFVLTEHRKLKKQTQQMGQLLSVAPEVIKPDDFPKLIKSILSIPSAISIVNIQRLPIEPWVPKELAELHLPTYFATILKFNFEIEFKGTFFNTIDFLQKLEKLPWELYWDSIEYKVTGYPEADVRIRLHALIEEKSGR